MSFSINGMQEDKTSALIDENEIYMARRVAKNSYICKQYSCPQERCRYSHGKLSVIESHIKLHQLEEGDPLKFTCGTCDFLSVKKSVFKRHQQSHKERQYACSRCPKMLKYKDSLVRHKKTQHTANKKLKKNKK